MVFADLQDFMSFRRRNDPPPDKFPELEWSTNSINTTVTNGYGKINFINVEHVGGKKPAKVTDHV